MITWYTSAWFDKYLKHSCTADRRLLTQRWRHDAAEAAVDPKHNGNMFSFYYPSRLDFRLANGKWYDNKNLRSHTRGLKSHDGYRGKYSYLSIDTSPDTAETKWGACRARAGSHRAGRRSHPH
jgi:hypothetical protein